MGPNANPTNLFAGPADVYIGPFGATEPLNALTAPVSPFRDMGITGAEAMLDINQTYVDLVGEQSAIPFGADLASQATSITCSFAEMTLPTLRKALNMADPVGTNEVQTVNLGAATAGTVTIAFDGKTTGAIAYNATAATVQTALTSAALGDITASGGPFPGAITLTFGGAYAGANQPAVVVTPTGLTGGTVTVATTTDGAPGPTLSINGQLTNSTPNYASVLLRGRKPGGGMRHAIVRRALSTAKVDLAWQKGTQKFIPVTFQGYWVSQSIDAIFIDDRQS